jgi:hypothetical protein
MICPLCKARKGRRVCPAVQASICAACCGAKRIVEVNCPDGCVYLRGGSGGAWDGRVTEEKRDARRLYSIVGGLSETQRDLAFALMLKMTSLHEQHPDVDDRLLSAAMRTLRRTQETHERGIIYAHRADDIRVQALVDALSEVLKLEGNEDAACSLTNRDRLNVVRAIERGLTQASTEEPDPLAFLNSVQRVMARLQRKAHAGRASEESRIIRPEGL